MKFFFYCIASIVFLSESIGQTAVFTSDSPKCLGEPISFTPSNTSGTILQETWDFGDGTVQIFDPPTTFPVFTQHTYVNYGMYNVTRTVKFQSATLNYSLMVQVIPPPVASFWVPSACMGTPVQFTDFSFAFNTYIVKWVWDFGDGSFPYVVIFPNNPNPQHVYAGVSTSYQVTLTVTTASGCTNSIIKPVNLLPVPVANFMWNPVYCSGDPIQFFDLSQPNGSSPISSFNWNFGDPSSGSTSVSTLQNPVHTFSAPAAYQVRLIAGNTSGCVDTIIKTVTVPAVPVITGPSASCPGQVSTYNATLLPGSYLWTLSGGGNIVSGAGTSQVQVQWTAAGVQSLSVTSSIPCVNGQPGVGTFPVTVTSIPTGNVVLSGWNAPAGTDTCILTTGWITVAGGGGDAVIDPGARVRLDAGTGISILPGAFIRYGTNFKARIAQQCDYCAGFKDALSISENTDDETMMDDGQIRFEVWPNPARDVVMVKRIGLPEGEFYVRLMDMTGRMIQLKKSGLGDVISLDLGGIMSGLYFIRITSNSGIEVRKMIKY